MECLVKFKCACQWESLSFKRVFFFSESDSGWVLQPDGSYARTKSWQSSSSSSSGEVSGQGNRGTTSGEAEEQGTRLVKSDIQ